MNAALALETVRTASGLRGLTRPGAMNRVLGARNVLQGGATIVGSRSGHADVAHGIGAVVDVVHALSMLGLAAVAPRHRRFALRSALVATGFALGEAAACSIAIGVSPR